MGTGSMVAVDGGNLGMGAVFSTGALQAASPPDPTPGRRLCETYSPRRGGRRLSGRKFAGSLRWHRGEVFNNQGKADSMTSAR